MLFERVFPSEFSLHCDAIFWNCSTRKKFFPIFSFVRFFFILFKNSLLNDESSTTFNSYSTTTWCSSSSTFYVLAAPTCILQSDSWLRDCEYLASNAGYRTYLPQPQRLKNYIVFDRIDCSICPVATEMSCYVELIDPYYLKAIRRF